MLLTITYTGRNTTDLGYLLYKNPSRPQVFELSHGKAYVFYPEISDGRTTAALLLDIDPLDLARGKVGTSGGGLFDYVNDRPYVSSSFMSTAISKVFGTAMTGRADAHQELSDSALDLTASVTMLPCRGERDKLNSVFEPLGYTVSFDEFISDENFPEWGESRYVNLTISGKVRLRDLLKHLYVLIPVFDRQKHYWVGADEVEKLLRLGEDWLPVHPEKAYITGRYLYRRRSLVNMAFERLATADDVDAKVSDVDAAGNDGNGGDVDAAGNDGNGGDVDAAGNDGNGGDITGVAPDVINTKSAAKAAETNEPAERRRSLNEKRLGSVIAALKNNNARSVIDLGCGEGKLLRMLMHDRQFTKIVGVDVSHVALERASGILKLERAGDTVRERVKLFQGSLTYKDSRFIGYDAACVIEVLEHLDAPRLDAFARVLFGYVKPPVIVLTTPNKEYNANYGFLYEEELRHGDHRFEWTRVEFRDWASRTAERFGYTVQFSEVGDADEIHGAPTQMGVFT